MPEGLNYVEDDSFVYGERESNSHTERNHFVDDGSVSAWKIARVFHRIETLQFHRRPSK